MLNPDLQLVPVILSGGFGTRLWPVSRESHPKPFMRLPSGDTLLQGALQRALSLSVADRLLLIVNRDHYHLTKDEVTRAVGANGGVQVSYLLEPMGRNTAAAIAMAAHWTAANVAPDAVMVVLPADHLVAPQATFGESVAAAADRALCGRLVTFGVSPTRPETGYGYIQAARDPNGNELALEVLRFVEKPDIETAKTFIQSGDFFWNSGMFCMRADVMLKEFQTHRAGVSESAARCWQVVSKVALAQPSVELPAEEFAAIESISIDHAVMERSRNLVLVPAGFHWDDVESWTSIASMVPADSSGNRIDGHAVLVESQNCYVRSPDRVTAVIGLDDVVVVDTPDALLISDAASLQHIRSVAYRLKQADHPAHREHRTAIRPWGSYTVLDAGSGYKIKRIEVKPQASLSLQMHHHRSEHWVVVSGRALVTCGNRVFELEANQTTYIPAGERHRLSNTGDEVLVMIEVQSGAYLGEDDIVRFSDVYGRA